ncbi:UDP-glucose 4-epimerase GalE [Planctomonas sp. JC2975]|uniref:UDP-glucose 4-epimerase GalE n=1 Tax=Planctomonas sp. JC2975 TaxID=2729626 RepID=UPI001475A737|nr:UDP-glucose 4-epimerase GalE [Planctomonas sp. JC2975]
MKVLITGGAGFIGSTIASALLDAGHVPVILDSFVTGRREFVEGRIHYDGDIADATLIRNVFAEHPDIDAVVHCAALIVVPESVAEPVLYYEANVLSTLRLVESLLDCGCTRLVFSSSASIYRPDDDFTVDENSSIEPLSPYARTKAIIEEMLEDISAASALRVMSLRYFNPIGADPRLRTGLQLPYPSHALGKLILRSDNGLPFIVTGTDYPTRDGTGIRDYVHVWDLAQAHVAALERFDDAVADHSTTAINLGTGRGTTVLELIRAFESVVSHEVAVEHAPRRPGDSAGAYTRSDKARELLGWNAAYSLTDGIADSLRWFDARSAALPDLVFASAT